MSDFELYLVLTLSRCAHLKSLLLKQFITLDDKKLSLKGIYINLHIIKNNQCKIEHVNRILSNFNMNFLSFACSNTLLFFLSVQKLALHYEAKLLWMR